MSSWNCLATAMKSCSRLTKACTTSGSNCVPFPSRMIAAGLLVIESRLVDAFARKRVVHVGQRHDPSAQGDLLPLQAARIAGAVVSLVMRQGDVLGHLQEQRLGTGLSHALQRLATQQACVAA